MKGFLQWSDFAVEGFYGFERTLFLQWSDFAVEEFYGVEMTLFFAVERICSGGVLRF